MRPVLQLQSARNRKRVRIRSGTNQDPTCEKSNSSRQSATKKSRDGERRPIIKFTLSVSIYGDPRDLVSFVRSMFFSSWTNVVQPISALLSSNTIPTTIDFSAPPTWTWSRQCFSSASKFKQPTMLLQAFSPSPTTATES